MFLVVLAYLGGVLTIVSPCVLPVIPFVFARADRPFRRSGLPMLAGMALTFAAFAGAATAGGNWIVRTNQYGRAAALLVMGMLGLTLLLPSFAEVLTRPLVRLGARLQSRQQQESSIPGSLILGASIGLLWAPCAGPILGLILGAAAFNGASTRTLGLLLAFAGGAATSLAVALFAGRSAFQAMKRGLGAEAWLRRAAGVVVLVAVVGIALGYDTRLLAKFSYVNTNGIESKLVNLLHPVDKVNADSSPSSADAIQASPTMTVKLDREGPFPSIAGAAQWFNSPPLSTAELHGKVVLVDFWTYSCINCLRTLPYIEAWAAKYRDQGLVVIGVHTPEFAFEKDPANVGRAVKDLGVLFPVALDSEHTIWNAFHNEYWPADYFIDASGQIRFHHFGEGSYDESERVIQELLADAHHAAPGAATFVQVQGQGAEASAPMERNDSPETYIGYGRAENFASPEQVGMDVKRTYSAPLRPSLNQWGLSGSWIVSDESAQLIQPGGTIVYRFHGHDLHLVLGSKDGKPIRFRVTLDGAAPGPDKGADVDAAGDGTVTDHRLYQLIRQRGPVENRTFVIQFLDPGVTAFAFTFG